MIELSSGSAPNTGVRQLQVLLIDNDRGVAQQLEEIFSDNGYHLSWANRPSTARELIAGRPDVILVDEMLPERDGFDVCRDLRGAGDLTPIIMLAPGVNDQNCIRGLGSGADDYLSKPFNPRVLLARIEAVLRRTTSVIAPTRPTPGLRLDMARKTLGMPRGEVALTLSEYQLLATMMASPGRCHSREELRAALGDGDPDYTSNRAIDIHVSRLRTKLEEDPRRPRHLVTVRGEGYRFDG